MKRRLMVLFLSLSAATVFAAGQKEEPPHGAAFFLFSSGRAPLRGAGLSAAIRGLPRLPPGQSCPLCPAPPFRRPLISAPIPRAFGGSDGRLRVCRLLTRRFDFGRISGLLRVCRLQGSVLGLFLQPLFPFRAAANACFSVTDARFLTDKRLISQ